MSVRCVHCGALDPHEPVTAAECALLAAHRDALAGLVDPADRRLRTELLDLYAHLRGLFPSEQAYGASRYVLELGWRPWVQSEAPTGGQQ